MNSNYSIRTDIKYDLTIGIITKNEEIYLEKCLKALLPLKENISCQIIVTDTGSTDKTIDIAEKYADIVLYFDWCNDFSLARNTCVDASSGAWFMYVDADEIFDIDVLEISKFINSKDRDNYDNAKYIIRNHHDNSNGNYTDLKTVRLFNFLTKKRYFKNEIFENIDITLDTFEIESIANHYGYLVDIIDQKKIRNQELVRSYYLKNPYDIYRIYDLINIVDFDEKLELFNNIIDIFENSEGTKYKKLNNKHMISAICLIICYEYFAMEKIEETLKLIDDYFAKSYYRIYHIENSTPSLEICYMQSIMLYKKGEYKKTIEAINNYQQLYKIIQENPDKIYCINTNYFYFKNSAYNHLFLIKLDCYLKINENENIIKNLIDENLTNYYTDLDLANYFYYIIKFSQIDVAKRVLEILGQEINIYNDKKSYLFFCLKLLVLEDIEDYLVELEISEISYFIDVFFDDELDYKFDALFKILSVKNNFNSLKEMLIYIKLMEKYIFVVSKIILNDDIKTKKYKLNEIFEKYIRQMYFYVETVYSKTIFENKQYDLLFGQEAFCYIMYPSLEQKNSNQIEYIRKLKEALNYCNLFNNVISNAIEVLKEMNSDSTVKTNSFDSEFQVLGEKIKLTIIEAIKANDNEKAKNIIDEYKKINPNDPDIENLYNIIKK